MYHIVSKKIDLVEVLLVISLAILTDIVKIFNDLFNATTINQALNQIHVC